ncbi:MAG: hypothetical protein J6U54_18125 [Clostridiales bacterium]|nr:hypothetical protein [Clostridiales bacterium]
MTTLKNYTCAECGGILHYDIDQELFSCPFCGADFAIGDFHYDEILKDIDVRLQNLEFHAAREKIDSLFEQYPNDPLVLRAHVLCEGRCSSIENLAHPDKMISCDLPKMELAAFDAGQMADEENKEYFSRLQELVQKAEKYLAAKKGTNAVPKVGDDTYRELMKAEDTFKEQKKQMVKSIPQELFVSISAAAIAGLVYFAGGGRKGVLIALTLAAIVIVPPMLIGNILPVIMYRVKTKQLRKNMGNLQHYDDTSEAEIRILVISYKKTYEELIRLTPASGGTPAKKPRAPKIPVSELIDFDKKIVCSSCGGDLIIDSEKQIYECKFCGIAYGSSLFFGNPFEKALKAMAHNEFTEAEQRFTHMLMLDPHDFNALLGRFLCVGKWKKIYDFTITQNIPQIRLQNLKEMINEIVAQSSDEDKEYFSTLQDMVDDRIKIADLEAESKRLKSSGADDETVSSEISQLAAEFDELRIRVVETNRDYDFIEGIPTIR